MSIQLTRFHFERYTPPTTYYIIQYGVQQSEFN